MHSLPLTRFAQWLFLAGVGLYAIGFLLSAPVPRKKPVAVLTAADMVGEWNLEYGAGKGTCQLARDGFYSEQWASFRYEGSWAFAGETLTVKSWSLDSEGNRDSECNWQAKLIPGRRVGKLTTGGAFGLTEIKRVRPDG